MPPPAQLARVAVRPPTHTISELLAANPGDLRLTEIFPDWPECVTVKKLKLKTHKATAKRARPTGGGKYLHLKSARTKYRRKKDPNRNRSLSKPTVMAFGDAQKMKRLLPYG